MSFEFITKKNSTRENKCGSTRGSRESCLDSYLFIRNNFTIEGGGRYYKLYQHINKVVLVSIYNRTGLLCVHDLISNRTGLLCVQDRHKSYVWHSRSTLNNYEIFIPTLGKVKQNENKLIRGLKQEINYRFKLIVNHTPVASYISLKSLSTRGCWFQNEISYSIFDKNRRWNIGRVLKKVDGRNC